MNNSTFMLFVSLLSACVALAGAALAQPANPPAGNYDRVQSDAVLDEASLPEDVRVAIRTAALLTRGVRDERSLRPVTFERGVMASLAKPTTTLPGFVADRFGLSAILAPAGGRQGRKLVGTLRFVEEAGRAALEGFTIDYGFTADAMTVRRVSLYTVMPENPRWMLYLVPKSRASMTDWQKFQTWGEAMDAMRALSVAPAQVRNEDCWVVLFALDRLPPGGQSQATLDGRAMTFVSKDFAGWPVLFGEAGPRASGPSVLRIRYGPRPPAPGASAEREFRF
ncbi:MAG: hypothetical protein KF899_03170 [Parvibaculum sp.]|nr:hypothetical protein [Parvibaculum sp.]